MVHIRKEISDFFRQILLVVLTIFFLPVIPTLIIISIPVYIYRYFLSKIAIRCKPDFLKILTTRSSIFAIDELYTQPRAPLLVFMVLQGEIGLIEGRNFLEEKLINALNEDGSLVRPELTHYIKKWKGFHFWKKDKTFDIANHVHWYDGPLKREKYIESQLYEIANELVTEPFSRRRSPWKIIGFKNCQDDSGENHATAICLKIHHALADGFSILKLVTELITSNGRILPPLPNYDQSTGIRKFFEILGLMFIAPYESLKVFIDSYDSNEWHINEKKLSRKINGAVLEKIPVDYIKEIKNCAKTSFTSVLLAAFTGGIRNFMIERGAKVPNTIHCLAPLPMIGHPDKMRNYMTLCWVTLPVGQPDPVQRLKTIDRHLNQMKRATFPIFAFYMIPFIGGMFPSVSKYMAKQFLSTAIMSNFPGPPDEVYYLGNPVVDMVFTGGMLPGNIGMGLTSVSYNGYIRIAAGIDESIVPASVPVKALVDKIARELDILKAEVTF